MLGGGTPGAAGHGLRVHAEKSGSRPPRDGVGGCSAPWVEVGPRAKGTAGRRDFTWEGPGGAAYTHGHVSTSSRKLCPLRGHAAVS